MKDDKKKKNSIDELSINTIRTLSMDAVQKANSGHPGTPMALVPAIYILYKKHLKFNPKNPKWFNLMIFMTIFRGLFMLLKMELINKFKKFS